MKKHLSRLTALALSVLLVVAVLAVPASAATYKKGANSISSSYKAGPYYQNYAKIPLTGDGRLDVVAVALSQLGYEESSSVNDLSGLNGSNGYNITEYNYNMGDFGSGYGYYWCATFVSWSLFQSDCTDQMGYKDWTRNHTGDKNYIWCGVSCSQWAAQLRRYGYWKNSLYQGGAAYTPQSGDLIFFTWDGAANSEDHIGIVVYSDGSTVYTVEGNTSDASGLDSNGGGVYYKSYSLSASTIAGYGIMPYNTVSSAKKIDYSGANPTTGLYMATQLKNVYANQTDSSYTWRMARFTMFEVIGVSADKSMVKAVCTTTTGETVTGWVKNNSDRILQLTVTEPADPNKVALEESINAAKGIKFSDYSVSSLEAFYTAYKNALSVYDSSSATSADYKAACDELNAIINNPVKVLSVGKSYTASAQMRDDTWTDDGIRLTDGAKGNPNGGNSGYGGWMGKLESVIDLGSSVTSDTFTVYLAAGVWGIALPKTDFYSVEVFASNSPDSGFTSIGTSNDLIHVSGSNESENGWTTYTLTVNAEASVNARYIKFVVTNEECTGHIWVDELEVSVGGPTASGVYLNGSNGFVVSGASYVFTPAFGTITSTTANHLWTTNIRAKWDATYGGYVVQSVASDEYTNASDVTLASDEIFIAAHGWEGEGVTDPVVGSMANKNSLATATVGQIIYLHGVDVANAKVLPGAYITFRGTGVVDGSVDLHHPGDPADCTNDQVCAACGKVLDEAHGHTEGEWEELDDGTMVLKCTVCGEVLDTKTADEYEKGDVNADGKINMFDYMLIKSIYLEKHIPTEEESARADANGDGKVNMFDYILVKNVCLQ